MLRILHPVKTVWKKGDSELGIFKDDFDNTSLIFKHKTEGLGGKTLAELVKIAEEKAEASSTFLCEFSRIRERLEKENPELLGKIPKYIKMYDCFADKVSTEELRMLREKEKHAPRPRKMKENERKENIRKMDRLLEESKADYKKFLNTHRLGFIDRCGKKIYEAYRLLYQIILRKNIPEGSKLWWRDIKDKDLSKLHWSALGMYGIWFDCIHIELPMRKKEIREAWKSIEKVRKKYKI